MIKSTPSKFRALRLHTDPKRNTKNTRDDENREAEGIGGETGMAVGNTARVKQSYRNKRAYVIQIGREEQPLNSHTKKEKTAEAKKSEMYKNVYKSETKPQGD